MAEELTMMIWPYWLCVKWKSIEALTKVAPQSQNRDASVCFWCSSVLFRNFNIVLILSRKENFWSSLSWVKDLKNPLYKEEPNSCITDETWESRNLELIGSLRVLPSSLGLWDSVRVWEREKKREKLMGQPWHIGAKGANIDSYRILLATCTLWFPKSGSILPATGIYS